MSIAKAVGRPKGRVASPEARQSAFLEVGDFKNLFLLLVSLLHGNLFFSLSESTLLLSEAGLTLEFWSLVTLNYVIFFRVVQSQLAAAMKYDSAWRLGAFDYIVVFLTVLFEYVLFNLHRFTWGSERFRLFLILGFAVFGAVGYVMTYLHTRRSLIGSARQLELLIQSLNVVFLLMVAILTIGRLVRDELVPLPIFNAAIAIIMATNIFVSMKLTFLARSAM